MSTRIETSTSASDGQSVRTLLSPGTGSLSSELLGLHTTGVSDQQGPVVLNQSLLELEGRSGVLVLGKVTAGVTTEKVARSVSQLLPLPLDLARACNRSETHATTPLAIACLKA